MILVMQWVFWMSKGLGGEVGGCQLKRLLK